AGGCPLPGSIAGAQLKHPASDKSLTLGNYHILPAIRDLAQGRQVKSSKDLFPHVIMETAADLIFGYPINQPVIMLGDLEGSLKGETKVVGGDFFHSQCQN